MLPASDRAASLFEVNFTVVVVWITPIASMSGMMESVTRANCHAAVNPTTNAETKVST